MVLSVSVGLRERRRHECQCECPGELRRYENRHVESLSALRYPSNPHELRMVEHLDGDYQNANRRGQSPSAVHSPNGQDEQEEHHQHHQYDRRTSTHRSVWLRMGFPLHHRD